MNRIVAIESKWIVEDGLVISLSIFNPPGEDSTQLIKELYRSVFDLIINFIFISIKLIDVLLGKELLVIIKVLENLMVDFVR